MEKKLLLRIEDAASLCSMSRAKFYQLVSSGVIPSIRLGRSRRIPMDALQSWIDEQVEARGTSPPEEAATNERGKQSHR